jgi:hypothetical protein
MAVGMGPYEDIVFPKQSWTKIGFQSKMKSASMLQENWFLITSFDGGLALSPVQNSRPALSNIATNPNNSIPSSLSASF